MSSHGVLTFMLHFRRSSPLSLLELRSPLTPWYQPVVSFLWCSVEPYLLVMPLDLISLLCFTFPDPLFQAVSCHFHRGHLGILPRIHFACISISEQTRISQDDPSAWITLGLVPRYHVRYLGKSSHSIFFYHRQTESMSVFPLIHARSSAFHELHLDV